MVIWDIIDNFLSQLTKFHEAKPTLNNPDDTIFNLDRSRKLLNQLISFIPAEPSKNPTSK